MQYQIFIQSQKDNFIASVVGMPNVMVEANTEEEAISKAKSELQAQLATGKFVTDDFICLQKFYSPFKFYPLYTAKD